MPDIRYLELLSKEYPTIKKASVEIINLAAILSLPKGTEYFFSDLHGENEAFIYMLKSASGVIREKIDWLFARYSVEERDQLTSLVCNPEELLDIKKLEPDFNEWCKTVIYKLIEICKSTSSKYTRSKVRKRLPKGFDYIMDELLHADDDANKAFYYSEIINSLIETDMAESFITELCGTISKLAVDRLHIVGDVYDRGPHPDKIMNYLIKYDNVDFQWGNHDIVWMGAAAGSWACIASVLRSNLSYNNFDMLEVGYGINLRPLSEFAYDVYKDDPCSYFQPHIFEQNKFDPVNAELAAKMHKAIAIIQFKLEAQLIERRPEYNMGGRTILETLDPEKGIVTIDGNTYELRDRNFPTFDKKSPYALSEDEAELMRRLDASFRNSEQLNKHMKFLFSHGALYQKINSNLLFHGCIPMDDNGDFTTVDLGDGAIRGRTYFDYLDKKVRRAYFQPKNNAADIMWYLWCGQDSPLFAKDKMTTFERYFIEDKKAHKEVTNPYYKYINDVHTCNRILIEFGLDPEFSHIINGHIPVKSKDGESPVRGGGKLFVIDGGMAKAYRKKTGIAGYTLISNSRYIAIAEHEPYKFQNENIPFCQPSPKIRKVEFMHNRVMVADTDNGEVLKRQMDDLKALVNAFRKGVIKEK